MIDVNSVLKSKGLSGPVVGEEPRFKSIPFPEGKTMALTVQLAFEAWSDNVASGSVLGTGLSQAAVAKGIPDFATISWQEYGGRTGMWRILEVLDRYGVKASCSTSALAALKWPELASTIAREGHEIVGHGYSQDQVMVEMDQEQDLEVVTRSTEILESASGQRPVGWSSHGSRRGIYTVLSLLKNGYLYTNDFRDADIPYIVAELDGEKLISLPRTDEINDMFLMRNHGASPSAYVDYFKRGLDQLRFEGQNSPKVLTCVAHGVLIGRPWGGSALAECLDYAKNCGDVWICTRRELAQYSIDKLSAKV